MATKSLKPPKPLLRDNGGTLTGDFKELTAAAEGNVDNALDPHAPIGWFHDFQIWQDAGRDCFLLGITHVARGKPCYRYAEEFRSFDKLLEALQRFEPLKFMPLLPIAEQQQLRGRFEARRARFAALIAERRPVGSEAG